MRTVNAVVTVAVRDWSTAGSVPTTTLNISSSNTGETVKDEGAATAYISAVRGRFCLPPPNDNDNGDGASSGLSAA